MYILILTASERRAMEWVGHRYSHGDDLVELLTLTAMDMDRWNSDETLAVHLRESLAWEVRDLLEESREGLTYACFSDSLSAKLNAFCDSII